MGSEMCIRDRVTTTLGQQKQSLPLGATAPHEPLPVIGKATMWEGGLTLPCVSSDEHADGSEWPKWIVDAERDLWPTANQSPGHVSLRGGGDDLMDISAISDDDVELLETEGPPHGSTTQIVATLTRGLTLGPSTLRCPTMLAISALRGG